MTTRRFARRPSDSRWTATSTPWLAAGRDQRGAHPRRRPRRRPRTRRRPPGSATGGRCGRCCRRRRRWRRSRRAARPAASSRPMTVTTDRSLEVRCEVLLDDLEVELQPVLPAVEQQLLEDVVAAADADEQVEGQPLADDDLLHVVELRRRPRASTPSSPAVMPGRSRPETWTRIGPERWSMRRAYHARYAPGRPYAATGMVTSNPALDTPRRVPAGASAGPGERAACRRAAAARTSRSATPTSRRPPFIRAGAPRRGRAGQPLPDGGGATRPARGGGRVGRGGATASRSTPTRTCCRRRAARRRSSTCRWRCSTRTGRVATCSGATPGYPVYGRGATVRRRRVRPRDPDRRGRAGASTSAT